MNHHRIKLATTISCCALLMLATAPATAQLVGHWQFDNAADVGQATLSSNLQAAGNAAYTASGKLGGGLSLDGAGDYLRVGAGDPLAAGMPTGDSSYTLSAFIQTTNSGGQARNGIIGWGAYGSSGQVNAFRTGDGAALTNYGWGGPNDYANVGAPGIFDGNWHHVLATYDSATSTKRLYFNGSEIGAGFVLGNNLNVQSSSFRIGSTNNGEFFNGSIDDVAVWSEPLTADEATSLVDVANDTDLLYDASNFNLLKELHDTGSGSIEIGDLTWTYANNLTDNAGLTGGGTDFTLVLNANNDTGLIGQATVIPEPTSVALWLLLAGGLAVFARKRLSNPAV